MEQVLKVVIKFMLESVICFVGAMLFVRLGENIENKNIKIPPALRVIGKILFAVLFVVYTLLIVLMGYVTVGIFMDGVIKDALGMLVSTFIVIVCWRFIFVKPLIRRYRAKLTANE